MQTRTGRTGKEENESIVDVEILDKKTTELIMVALFVSLY
jgi:hypothetical protein